LSELIVDIIEAKRENRALSRAQIQSFINGVTDGAVSDAQIGAFTMAVYLNGMTPPERVILTEAMRDSGQTLSWDLDGPVADKHSTGGVGDCVSLVLAPALAACGVYVPMISGRGLGHTGGTLDKLDAIPGYQTTVDDTTFRKVVGDVGCAIIGQSAALAPADKRLYSIRDVCATVGSADLICSSILSKKLAAGLDSLVLDIKWGNGSNQPDVATAEALAQTLVEVANGAGCRTTAVVTDMNEPLASAAGNALEVANCMKLLRGDEIDARLWDVTVHLGGVVLMQSGLAGTPLEARARITEALQSGAAAAKFGEMVAGLGGPRTFLDEFEQHLPHAPIIEEVLPDEAGFVSHLETQTLGRAVVALGGGRLRADAPLDYSVGVDWVAGIGLSVEPDTPLARVHAPNPEAAAQAVASVKRAFTISDRVPPEPPLIVSEIAP